MNPVGRHLVGSKSILDVILYLETCTPVGQGDGPEGPHSPVLNGAWQGRIRSCSPFTALPPSRTPVPRCCGVELCSGVSESAQKRGECTGGGPHTGECHLDPSQLVRKNQWGDSPKVSVLQGRGDAGCDHSPTVGNEDTQCSTRINHIWARLLGSSGASSLPGL